MYKMLENLVISTEYKALRRELLRLRLLENLVISTEYKAFKSKTYSQKRLRTL